MKRLSMLDQTTPPPLALLRGIHIQTIYVASLEGEIGHDTFALRANPQSALGSDNLPKNYESLLWREVLPRWQERVGSSTRPMPDADDG